MKEYVERERAKRRRRQFTITVPAHVGEYIEERAREEGVSKSAVVAYALQKHIDAHVLSQMQREGGDKGGS